MRLKDRKKPAENERFSLSERYQPACRGKRRAAGEPSVFCRPAAAMRCRQPFGRGFRAGGAIFLFGRGDPLFVRGGKTKGEAACGSGNPPGTPKRKGRRHAAPPLNVQIL